MTQGPAHLTAGAATDEPFLPPPTGDQLGQVEHHPPLTLRAARGQLVIALQERGVGVECDCHAGIIPPCAARPSYLP